MFTSSCKTWEPPLFHVESEDYFGTLATIVGLLKERLDQKNEHEDEQTHQLERTILERIKQDLIFLQRTHAIVQKEQRYQRLDCPNCQQQKRHTSQGYVSA